MTIAAQVSSNNPVGATGHAFLTTRIGPGATLDNQVAATSFVFPALGGFDLCYADGIGVVLALMLTRLRRVRKVTANNFFHDLCTEAERRGLSFAFIGARSGIAQQLADTLHRRFPALSIPVVRCGFLNPSEEAQVVGELRAEQVRIVILGRGQPL